MTISQISKLIESAITPTEMKNAIRLFWSYDQPVESEFLASLVDKVELLEARLSR